MATPEATLPIPVDGTSAFGARVRTRARRLVRGRPADPPWSRPALIAVALLAGVLMLWGLTRSSYANTYYASAVYAASKNWSAFFYNALDVSRYVSVDKTPFAVWLMALSSRVFGFGSFSMLLPDALAGIASVLVLHNVVKRTLGHRAAILAALILALTPVAVLMARYNNPDAVLVLLLVCAAWALVRALESGRTRYVVLCGVLVGLAFNTKMLQAYLVVPALGLAFLVAGPGRARRRIAQLAAGTGAMVAVSAAWVGTMMLIPASSRPYVGDSTNNSWWNLIFSANGLDRVGSGQGGPAGGFGGSQGALRLFNPEVGGQIAWLLPLAAVGLVTGLWIHRRAARNDAARASYVLWGTWALVHFYVFSFSLNLFHPYYTSALAPAVAALAAGGAVSLWDRSRHSVAAAAVLAAALAGTAVLAFSLLGRTPDFVPWLRWVIVALAAAAVIILALLRLGAEHRRRVALAGVACAAVAILAGPAAYAIATVGRPLSGGNPLAGPASAEARFASAPAGLGRRAGGYPQLGFGPPPGAPAGGPPPGGGAPRAGGPPANGLPLAGGPPPNLPSGAGGARFAGGGGPPGADAAANKQLISYLKAHKGSAKYLVAAVGSQTAAPIMLATHDDVITIGGFMGGDPAPTVSQLERLIASGQLRYVLLSRGGGGGPPRLGGAPRFGARDLDAGRGFPGAPGRANARRRSALESWVTGHCTVVNYSSSSSSGQSLYHCGR